MGALSSSSLSCVLPNLALSEMAHEMLRLWTYRWLALPSHLQPFYLLNPFHIIHEVSGSGGGGGHRTAEWRLPACPTDWVQPVASSLLLFFATLPTVASCVIFSTKGVFTANSQHKNFSELRLYSLVINSANIY